MRNLNPPEPWESILVVKNLISILLFQPEKERRLKEKNAANTKKFMDERKNNMLNQNKKREKQKKTHAKELENIHKYIEEVSSIIFLDIFWVQ